MRYESSLITANITDNFDVSSAWIFVELPNQTNLTQFMNNQSSYYYTYYSSDLPGIHRIKVCANDTVNLTSCTDYMDLFVSGNTSLALLPSNKTIYLDNVTLTNSQEFELKFNLSNLGHSRALNLSVNLLLPPNFEPDETSFYIRELLKNSSLELSSLITALKGSLAGTYLINLSVNWTNLDGTNSSNLTSVKVEILPKPVIDIVEKNVSIWIPSGLIGKVTITLNSTGNTEVQNIIMSCYSGEVCDNFTVTFNPDLIPSLAVGSSTSVEISISVPDGFPAGNYYGIIKANASQTEDEMLLEIRVPVNLTWEQSPNNLTKEVIQGTSGYLGYITLKNTGNTELLLKVGFRGRFPEGLVFFSDGTLYKTVSLEIGESKKIWINYSAPQVTELTTYTFEVYSYNISSVAGPQEKSTNFTLIVHPFYVNITEPTEQEPKINVTKGELLNVKVNVTYANYSLTSLGNVSFQLYLESEVYSSNITNFTAVYSQTEGLWILGFEAPDLPEGVGYDVVVKVKYIDKQIEAEDREAKAIVYRDVTPPLIDIYVPPKVRLNTTVTIPINVTDLGGVKSVRVIITYPDNSTQSFVPNFVGRVGSIYMYKLIFSNTTYLGTYIINVTAYDVSDNFNSTSKEFGVYPLIFFAGIAQDLEQVEFVPIQPIFDLLAPGTNEIAYEIIPNASGYYNETIDARTYDLKASIWNATLLIYSTPILTDVYNPLVFGKIPPVKIGKGALDGIYVGYALNFSQATLSLSYEEFLGKDISQDVLGIYYCSDWIRYTGCNSTWKRLTSVVNPESYEVLTPNITSLDGAFALAPYICGNGVCEKEYGESSAVCPQDCPPPAPGPPAPPAPPAPPGPRVVLPGVGVGVPVAPYTIKSTLIFVKLRPGEYEIHSIDIVNNLDSALSGTISVEGNAWEFVQIEKPTFTVPPKRMSEIKIKVYTLPTTHPGIYTGDIVLTIRNETHRVPITLKVEVPPEPLLDVKIEALTKTVEPNGTLKVQVTVINMGETPTIEDIVLNYTIKTLFGEELAWVGKETIGIEQVKTFIKKIHIPESLEPGKYLIEVHATYWNGQKHASAADTFEVSIVPVPVKILKAIMMSPWTYFILFGMIPAVFAASRLYWMMRLRKAKKARYIFPVDFKKLPRKGPNSIEVGKIAETDVKAYFDISQLIMHTLAAGGTGSGKSVSAMVVAEELLKRGIPVIVFDPTAQWTGFIKPCKDPHMLDFYSAFGLKPEDARGFKTNIIVVTDPNMPIDIKKYMKKGEITVFVMNRLKPEQIDKFVRRSIDAVFAMRPKESKKLELLLVYDEVHRLLPKYGGKGGYVAIEKGAREFRKWGIGLYLISQVLLDFKGAIRANIATEVQLRTKYEGDINRIKTKYGREYASKVVQLTVGTGLVQNPEYNEGKPWFVSFRPLLHSTFALSDEELDQYMTLNLELERIEREIERLKRAGRDVSDIEVELNLAKDKLKQGMFKMVETYIESLKASLRRA
ncbi:MAG TPA: DUF87 domain-containing protein [Thermococcus sp.]|nr:DUF87 domain-containing protein [Thermococcus sp.]